MIARRASVLLLGSAVAGCDGSSARRAPLEATGSTAATASLVPSAPTAGSAATSAAPAGSSRASERLAGSWSGTYEAKRGKVELPKGSPWPAWRKDNGKRLGKGTLELTVESNGDVHGTASGALGDSKVRGRVEDGVLRAGVAAADPSTEGAMAGRLTATLKDDSMGGELRASDERGDTVRVAEVLLRRRAMR
jgi:hypothetical protein